MCTWITRYEEGYLTMDGESVLLADELRHDPAWNTPDEARSQWLSLETLAEGTLEMVGNGFVQTDDVSEHTQFNELGVVKIWRRVTFELSQDSVRMNLRTDVKSRHGA